MATIGFATLQIIPSLQGVSEAIEKQVAGKVVSVKVEPKVDQPATEKAGKQARETVEKHTKQVKVEPKVDQKAAEDAGKKTAESVAKGIGASQTLIGGFVVGALQGAGSEAGLRLGQKIADSIPTGLTGVADRVATALRNSLPTAGQAAGTALGTAVGVALTNAIGKERLDKAGVALMTGLSKAVKAANVGTDIGVAIGTKVAVGLKGASTVVNSAAGGIRNTISDVTSGVDGLKNVLGGEDSFAAPALNGFNDALGKATPLLNAVTGAATLAATGAQSVSAAVGIAQKAQLLWNAALIANPIGLVVAAIAAIVAGLVLFFTKTELGRKIWQGFTEYLKIAWEGIKIAFGAAWDVISGVWDSMVKGAQVVWDGVKEKFTNLVDFVKGLPGAIARAAVGLWDGLKQGLVAVLNWIGDKWNRLADILSIKNDTLGIDISLPKAPKFSYASGGYTGEMSPSSVAGVVHGGEYVINARATAGIERSMPGLLSYLNKLPGYKGGGKVELGNISAPGITTGEQQSMWDAVRGKFPGAILSSATRTVMTEGHPDYHNAGRAIDISGPGMGSIASWIASNFPDSLELIHSPFGQNIKNGKSVGDGMAFYGAGLMKAHENHVHWALGKMANMSTSDTGISAAMPEMTAGDGMSSIGSAISAPAMGGGTSGNKFTLSSSLSGLASTGLDQINPKTKVTDKSPERAFDIGGAATAAIGGQLQSAMGIFGINDSPGWLKGIATLANGITVGDSITPVSSMSSSTPATGSALGSVQTGSGAAPGPVTNFNIQTTDIEPAYLASQRIAKENALAEISRF